jgi:hypothetical protein
LKIKRKVVMEKYKDAIERIYAWLAAFLKENPDFFVKSPGFFMAEQ